MRAKTTISDIARALNTTPATVSRALHNHPKISQHTKQLVTEAAQKLNYKPNRIASSLRSGKSHVIGVIIPSAEIKFFGSVVHGIESMANHNGYNILMYQSNESWEQEVKGVETFLAARVDGIVASLGKNTHEYSHFTDVRKRGIPIVLFDRVNDDLHISSVVIDDYKGGYIATEHLIQQGYRRIAHIAGPQHLKIFNDRLRGYLAALQAYNIKVDHDLVFPGDVSVEAGKNAVDYFLQFSERPDAFFAVEDFTALGVIKELKDRNYNIPAEFGVIGFANEMFGEHITPALSTIDQQTVQMGKETFTLLMQLMQQKDKTDSRQQKIVLDPVPLFRQSSIRGAERSETIPVNREPVSGNRKPAIGIRHF